MSYQKGMQAESRAAEYLQQHGFEIIERNFHSHFGEIDIIALKDEILHFVEVKSGRNFNPIYAITFKKMQRILKTIQFYLLQYQIDREYCISVVVIRGEEIELFENVQMD